MMQPVCAPRIIVTRPAHEAAQWVQWLQTAGWEAQAWPLIDIGPAPDVAALAQRRTELYQGAYAAAMFVSPQAVRGFWADVAQPSAQAWPTGVRAWAPGPGTARALQVAGVPLLAIDAPASDAAQFDSEALWAQVAPQVHPSHRLLLVRGLSQAAVGASPAASTDVPQGQGRDWLAQHCQAQGGQVVYGVAYQRRPPVWDATRCAQAQQALQDGSVWLLSSSEALAHLVALLPGAAPWAHMRVLATHPRIAQTARALGVGVVHTSRPAWPDVRRGLEELLS